MANLWNRWSDTRTTRDTWRYTEHEYNYSWLKRPAIAILLFAAVYGAHISETYVGQIMDKGIRYILTTETDFTYVATQIGRHLPNDLDLAVFKNMAKEMPKPPDPLAYMTKPAEGKIVSFFGWNKNQVSQSELLQGIEIEVAPGSTIKAAAAGNVKLIADSQVYGKTVIIEHGNGLDTMYGYLGEVIVNQGEKVSQGQVIARSSSKKVYFELREQGKAIDPLTRIKNEAQTKEGK